MSSDAPLAELERLVCLLDDDHASPSDTVRDEHLRRLDEHSAIDSIRCSLPERLRLTACAGVPAPEHLGTRSSSLHARGCTPAGTTGQVLWTVRVEKIERPSGARDARGELVGLRPVKSTPSTNTAPDVGATRPDATRHSRLVVARTDQRQRCLD
jgi:hypothetical protein